MAGWVPFWRNDVPRPRRCSERRWSAAREGSRRDAWAESRSLVGLASVTSLVGDEEDALAIALEALADRGGRRSGVHGGGRPRDGGGVAAAAACGSTRRSITRRPRSARSESSAPGGSWRVRSVTAARSTGSPGGSRKPSRDLREAFVLCRDLQERALVTLDRRRARPHPRDAGRPRGGAVGARASPRPGSPMASRARRPRCWSPSASWRWPRTTRRPRARRHGRRSRSRTRARRARERAAAQVWWAGSALRPRRGGRGRGPRGRPNRARAAPLAAGAPRARAGRRRARLSRRRAHGRRRTLGVRGWLHRPRPRGSL